MPLTIKVKEITDIVWREERTLGKRRKVLMVKLLRKGNLKGCKNWRGITLLPVVRVCKMMGKIVIERIQSGVKLKLRKEQAVFRRSRGTTKQNFMLRNIIKQSIE